MFDLKTDQEIALISTLKSLENKKSIVCIFFSISAMFCIKHYEILKTFGFKNIVLIDPPIGYKSIIPYSHKVVVEGYLDWLFYLTTRFKYLRKCISFAAGTIERAKTPICVYECLFSYDAKHIKNVIDRYMIDVQTIDDNLMVFTGSKSPYQKNVERVAKKYIIISDMGHHMIYENPSELLSKIREVVG